MQSETKLQSLGSNISICSSRENMTTVSISEWRVALKDHMGLDDDEELFELTDTTLCDMDSMYATLSQDRQAWDMQQLKRSVHSLKGTMGTIGFTPLYGTYSLV